MISNRKHLRKWSDTLFSICLELTKVLALNDQYMISRHIIFKSYEDNPEKRSLNAS